MVKRQPWPFDSMRVPPRVWIIVGPVHVAGVFASRRAALGFLRGSILGRDTYGRRTPAFRLYTVHRFDRARTP